MNTIGQNIAYFRKQKNMTQEELAEKMSVTAQAISKWECDASYPDIITVQALSKVLFVKRVPLFLEIVQATTLRANKSMMTQI